VDLDGDGSDEITLVGGLKRGGGFFAIEDAIEDAQVVKLTANSLYVTTVADLNGDGHSDLFSLGGTLLLSENRI
jgi:hypothetical protein